MIGECTIVAVAGAGQFPPPREGAGAGTGAGAWPVQLVNRASTVKVLNMIEREGLQNCMLVRLQFDGSGSGGETETRLQPILAKLAQKQRLGTNYVSSVGSLVLFLIPPTGGSGVAAAAAAEWAKAHEELWREIETKLLFQRSSCEGWAQHRWAIAISKHEHQ